MSLSHKPITESGVEWCGNIAGTEYKASGSFGPALGYLSIYGEGADGGSCLLGTVTWNGAAIERMPEISSVLAMVAAELRETLAQDSSARS